MTKYLVVGIIVIILMSLAVAASAYTVDENIKMAVKFANSTGSTIVAVGTITGGKDGFDPINKLPIDTPANGVAVIYTNDLTPLKQDLCAPITSPGIKVWSLKAYVNGGSASTCTLLAWMTSSGQINSPDYTAKLYEGTWSAQQILAGDAGTYLCWNAPLNASGTSTSPQFTATSLSMGPNATRYYTVAIQMVPEPGSMVALLSGLVGFVGFGIRRRK